MIKQPNYVFDDELYHHGIPGQKHGLRRWQNEDGSLTPEGYIHYGYGKRDEKEKHDFKTYKADLKSTRQMHKATLSGEEERHRIREQAKTNRLIRKEERKQIREQARNERLFNREQQKINEDQRNNSIKNSKKMSDEDLRKAIDRLKLEVEYNRNLAVVNDSKSALAKADRFFSGPTGEAVRSVAVAAMPSIAQAFTQKAAEAGFKYANRLDKEAKEEANKQAEEQTKLIQQQVKTDILKEKVERERQKILLNQLKNPDPTTLNNILNKQNTSKKKNKGR